MESKANKTGSYYFEKKVKVFNKQKIVQLSQFFKKIYWFVGDALVAGTKL